MDYRLDTYPGAAEAARALFDISFFFSSNSIFFL